MREAERMWYLDNVSGVSVQSSKSDPPVGRGGRPGFRPQAGVGDGRLFAVNE